MPVAIRKVYAKYREPVGIRKAVGLSTAACSYKHGCIYIFHRLLISKLKYLLANNYLHQMDTPLCG